MTEQVQPVHHKLYLGVDLGGSHVSSWLFDGNGKSHDPFSKMSINPNLESAELVDLLVDFLRYGCLTAQSHGNFFAAAGLASPGPLDPEKGTIVSPPNLPNIKNLEIIKLLWQRTGLKTFLINDADAAILGEHWIGSAKGFNNAVMLTLGTGIGSGVIADGKLQRGRGMGGEWGHTTIRNSCGQEDRLCSCGRKNCLESFCGAEGLVKTYCAVFDEKRESLTSKFVLELSKKMVENQADWRWLSVLKIYCSDLAEGVLNIINVHHPDCVILGGGIASNAIMGEVRKIIHDIEIDGYKLGVISCEVVINRAVNPNSGVIGAAKYAIDCCNAEIKACAAKRGITT